MRWRYTLHLDVVSGWLALHQGDTSTAIDKAGACADAARAAGSIRYVGRGSRLRGMVLAEFGDIAEAETALAESLSAANEVGNPYQTWRTLASLSEVRFAAGRLDEAAATARDALTIVDGVADSLSDTAHVAPLLSCAAVRTLREWADHAGSEAPDLRNPLGTFA